MSIEINALETARFGITCARFENTADPLPNLRDVTQSAVAQGICMISTRVDVADLARVHAFEAEGYQLMDTLVYYARSLSALPVAPDPFDYDVAKTSDAEEIAEVSRAAFSGYIGHYHADPRLENAKADAAYADWARRGVLAQNPHLPVLVRRQNGQIIGFLMARMNTASDGEILLAGMAPQAQGQGLYAPMFLQGLHAVKVAGGTRAIISTQVNNYAVQKVWTKFGLSPFKSCYTFHKWLC